MKLSELLAGVELIERHAGETEIYGICESHELACKGTLFVCIRGLHFDSHTVMPEVAAAGSIVVCEEKPARDIEYILVKSTRAALPMLYANFYGSPQKKLRLIGVTGTNGKTTTVSLIGAILRAAGHKCELSGTLTGELTTPDPRDFFGRLKAAADCGCEYFVTETSSHSLALDKLHGLRFAAGVFTNLTPEHLDFHKTMEQYALAKAKLFNMSDIAVLNADDKYSKIMLDRAGLSFTYSVSGEADYTAENISPDGIYGVSYTLCKSGVALTQIKSRMAGRFTVYNTLAAAAAALALGISAEHIAAGILSTEKIPGRLQRVETGTDFDIFIDFAHTPDALENVLLTMRELRRPEQRLTVLFGCGGDRDRSKRRVMGSIASALADFVIVTSDNSRNEDASDIVAEIMKGIDKERPHAVIYNRQAAIEYAVDTAGKGDIILLCGKGHEAYEIDRRGKRPFSEYNIVQNQLKKRKNR